jgi:hypothetical protein
VTDVGDVGLPCSSRNEKAGGGVGWRASHHLLTAKDGASPSVVLDLLPTEAWATRRAIDTDIPRLL